MAIDRRRFLGGAGAMAAVGAGAACVSRSAATALAPRAARPQKILILGGTAFLGPEIVAAARARGHEVTLFNRGRTHPELFGDLEKLRGDRNDDLDSLRGRRWDAVVDTSGYVPRHVRGPAELLAESVEHYTFISTCSVYPDLGTLPIDESSRLATLDDPTVERVDGATYGALKVLCEAAAERAMPGRVCSIRPGLIVGPGDTSDRFAYWPLRVLRGGEVLAPGSPRETTQFSDVRDLAAFVVTALEKRLSGPYNVNGPSAPVEMGTLLETCREVARSQARFTWVESDFLAAQGVRPWSDLPAWFPPPPGQDQVPPVACARALAQGLAFRPVSETIAATLEFEAGRPGASGGPRSGLSAERERAVLDAWAARAPG